MTRACLPLLILALLASSASAESCPPIERTAGPPVYVVLYGYPYGSANGEGQPVQLGGMADLRMVDLWMTDLRMADIVKVSTFGIVEQETMLIAREFLEKVADHGIGMA